MSKIRFLPVDDLSPGDHGSYTSTHHKPEADKSRKANGGDAEPAVRLQWIDTGQWDNEPCPQRDWAIFERVPMRQVTLFSGEGAIGKSIVELMCSVAHVVGGDWLGSLPELGGPFISAAKMTNRNCVFGSRRLPGTTAPHSSN